MIFKILTKNYHTFSDEASITSSSSSTTSSHKYLVTNQNSNSIMKSTGSKSDLQKSEQVFVPPDGGFQVRNSWFSIGKITFYKNLITGKRRLLKVKNYLYLKIGIVIPLC